MLQPQGGLLPDPPGVSAWLETPLALIRNSRRLQQFCNLRLHTPCGDENRLYQDLGVRTVLLYALAQAGHGGGLYLRRRIVADRGEASTRWNPPAACMNPACTFRHASHFASSLSVIRPMRHQNHGFLPASDDAEWT